MITLEILAAYLPFKLQCQYEGIINGKELSEQDRQFKKDGLPFDFDVAPIMGTKTGTLKQVKIFKNYWKCYIGTVGLKSFYNGNDFKPLFRPLSELTEEHLDNSPYVTRIEFEEEILNGNLPYSVMNRLLSDHYNVFNLPEGEYVRK